MNKFAIIGAFLAFVVPIACVLGLQMDAEDLANMLDQKPSAVRKNIPSGKLLYFYAPS